MSRLRTVGTLQILILLAMVAVSSSIVAMAVLSLLFCGALTVTWNLLSKADAAFAGWRWSFSYGFVFYVLPVAALAYFVLDIAYIPALLSAGCALLAEIFRERQKGECQLSWMTPLLVVFCIGLAVQLGSFRAVLIAASIMTALLCVSLTAMCIPKPATVISDVSASAERPAGAAAPRSYGRAA